ncbi:MAG TPA: hypothetical protein PL051_01420 [Candidatus Saccharibacteria bacterium]|nr:hypothetical protein [Candidatus Saccharibacteria bacterium]
MKNDIPMANQLASSLRAAYAQQNHRASERTHQQTVHVVGAGAAITAAYEQLRNAAEYTEEHLLLQRAIRRFYKRIFLLRDKKRIASSGDELIVELTQAGYIANDSITEQTVATISEFAMQYYEAYLTLTKRRTVSYQQVEQWTIELLAVEAEWLLHDTGHLQAFTQFAHSHFLSTLDFSQIFKTKPKEVETALYVAIHRALLKSDDAVVRLGLLKRYQQSPDHLEPFVETNRHIDALLDSSTTEKLFRIVDRRGAPLRVLRHMVDNDPTLSEVLPNKDQFLTLFEKQVNEDYEAINSRVNHGIIRSVVFLIITKVIIGIAIEVPYDYFIHDAIIFTPLIINLFFPPLYMILLRATLMLPGPANTKRLVEQAEMMLYDTGTSRHLERRASQKFGAGYNIVYGALFVAVFGTVAWVLWQFFQFELLHLAVFFVFLSAASFLGFRLSRLIREMESIDTYQNGVTIVRDFLYMPFVVVGRYISDKYSRVNIVALALDMLIELPLKTVLRLIRQWGAFISAKKDQL